MPSLQSLLTFFGASLLLALTPGPDNLFVLGQSMLRGRRAGLAITLGLCTGLCFHTALVVLGVALLIRDSQSAFLLLKLTGAAYLIYLAWRIFTSAPLEVGRGSGDLSSLLQLYRRGIIMNVSNPKVSLFFLAFLPQFTNPAAGPAGPQMLLLGALFLCATLLVFGGVAVLAEVAGRRLLGSVTAQRLLNRLAAAVFLLLALRLLLENP